MINSDKTFYPVGVKISTKDDIMLFKLKMKAKNADEVIKKALKLLREHIK